MRTIWIWSTLYYFCIRFILILSLHLCPSWSRKTYISGSFYGKTFHFCSTSTLLISVEFLISERFMIFFRHFTTILGMFLKAESDRTLIIPPLSLSLFFVTILTNPSMLQTYAFGTPRYPAAAETVLSQVTYMVYITGRHGSLGNTVDLNPSSFFALFLDICSFMIFLPFSFIQQNWGDNDCILRNCPFVSLLIYFHHMSYSSCTTLSYFSFPLFFFLAFYGMRKKNLVSVMLCLWTESWISLFSSNLMAAANNEFAFLLLHRQAWRE